MLGGIHKISTTIDTNKKQKLSDVEKNPPLKGKHKQGAQDSIVFSPFTTFLSEINWTAKELRFQTKEKLSFIFEIPPYEFQGVVDFATFQTTSRMYYRLRETRNPVYDRYTVLLTLRKDQVSIAGGYRTPNFQPFNILFANIASLDVETDIERKSSPTLFESLTQGVEIPLAAEMLNVTLGLFRLLDKLENFTLSALTFPPGSGETVAIERIITTQ